MLKKTKKFFVDKNSDGEVRAEDDILVVEEALQLHINFSPYTITMRTPVADEELLLGLLFTEGIVTDWSELPTFEVIQVENDIPRAIRMRIDPAKITRAINDNRSLISSSACGVCGKRELGDIACDAPPVAEPLVLEGTQIQHMIAQMQEQQPIFSATGACHAAAAFAADGKHLAVFEDVGRHNAVDKVIGALLKSRDLEKAAVLAVSGRVSYEIMVKAARAGFRAICAVSAPSSLAVEIAKEHHIALYGFCRGSHYTKYA